TLAAEIHGQKQPAVDYEGPTISVGRNPATCQIVFDQKQWPTVSRQHAQLQLQNGRWFVTDTGSTYGTFVNGQPIKAPAELHVSSRLQFGVDGPIFVVTGVTVESFARKTIIDSPPPPQSFPNVSQSDLQPTQSPHDKLSGPFAVELSGAGTGH